MGSYYYIKKGHGLYFCEIEKKKIFFIKLHKVKWVLDYDEAKAFVSEEDADECIQTNKLNKRFNVEVVKKNPESSNGTWIIILSLVYFFENDSWFFLKLRIDIHLSRLHSMRTLDEILGFFNNAIISERGLIISQALHKVNLIAFEDIKDEVNNIYAKYMSKN